MDLSEATHLPCWNEVEVTSNLKNIKSCLVSFSRRRLRSPEWRMTEQGKAWYMYTSLAQWALRLTQMLSYCWATVDALRQDNSASTRRWPGAVLMLYHRLRRWSNIRPASAQRLVLARNVAAPPSYDVCFYKIVMYDALPCCMWIIR